MTPGDRRQLGKFEVLTRLSTGGMSEIFLAHQLGLGGFRKLVVLKTILPDISGEEDFVSMFLDEARITASFNHPNIAQVFELDVSDGKLFMAMEFVQGCTLVEMARACLHAKEPIPIGFSLMAVRDTALALHYAHTFTDLRGRRQVVIHRDVAEKNIMVTYEGVTKLLDFGIAKALGRSNSRTTVGMVKGTSGYMSPEQIKGEPLDGRSDLFSLGVVAHECLTGMRLFFGKSAHEGMLAVLREPIQPPSKNNPSVSPEIDAVVMKALQRNREDRYGTTLEFARELEKASAGQIWLPEQTAVLVQKHFNTHRLETRKLIESALSAYDTSGEISVDSVLAQVRASSFGSNDPRSSRPLRATGPESPRRPSAPQPPPTPPIPAPAPPPRVSRPNVDSPTVAARPSVRPPSLSRPPDAVSDPHDKLEQAIDPSGSYSGQAEAKTIPAIALPEALKALRDSHRFNIANSKPSGDVPIPSGGPPADTQVDSDTDTDPNQQKPRPVPSRRADEERLTNANWSRAQTDNLGDETNVEIELGEETLSGQSPAVPASSAIDPRPQTTPLSTSVAQATTDLGPEESLSAQGYAPIEGPKSPQPPPSATSSETQHTIEPITHSPLRRISPAMTLFFTLLLVLIVICLLYLAELPPFHPTRKAPIPDSGRSSESAGKTPRTKTQATPHPLLGLGRFYFPR